MKRGGAPLREGYSTGSCAAAAAVAAFRGSADSVALRLPSGGVLRVPVLEAGAGWAVVVKDGGDDPDVTTGLPIRVDLSPNTGEAETADYEECADGLELLVRGGDGVGRVTRPGLAVPVGKAAINPVPRRMMAENLAAAGCLGRWLAVVSVAGGAETAAKTLNPALGIVGGISILGTSGIVHPYSNAAYGATIQVQLRSTGASGGRVAALVTGGRTAAAVARDFPEIPPEARVSIADFIYLAVTAAAQAGIPRLVVACMPGKLFKYACGERYTHAHAAKMDLGRLAEFGCDLPVAGAATMGELQARVAPSEWRAALRLVKARAEEVLQGWAGQGTAVEVALYETNGERMELE